MVPWDKSLLGRGLSLSRRWGLTGPLCLVLTALGDRNGFVSKEELRHIVRVTMSQEPEAHESRHHGARQDKHVKTFLEKVTREDIELLHAAMDTQGNGARTP